MTDEELDEKLESLTKEDLQGMGVEEMNELLDGVYGDDRYDDEEEKPVRQALEVHVHEGKTKDGVIAELALNPELRAVATIQDIGGTGFDSEDLNINALIKELNKQTELMRQKDLSRAESMLAAQAHTLDHLFNKLAVSAGANMRGGYLDAAEKYFKLALKSQSQCRTTWEAISRVQNPPITNVTKQTNIAKNQQINNGGEIQKPPNELLEKTHGQRLDTRAQGEAVKADSTVEALEEIHRSKDD